METCITCNKCVGVCPIINTIKITTTPKLYAARSTDDLVRYDSTSGGIFSEIAKYILLNNGTVFAAAYDSNHMVYHTHITEIDEIKKVRQSKYVQSNTGLTFREIKMLLDNGQTVLFVGSPCQIAGLKNYLQSDYDNLILIDFICRGSNSNKAYRKWLEDLEIANQSKVSRVWFKNKEKGWNQFSTRVEFENSMVYSKDRSHDLYIQGYIRHNLYIRRCCENCLFKGIDTRLSDITLGDYWGIDKDDDDDLGTSVVLINSEQGNLIFSEVLGNLHYCEKPVKEIVKRNPMVIESVKINPLSDRFFELLSEKGFYDSMYEILGLKNNDD